MDKKASQSSATELGSSNLTGLSTSTYLSSGLSNQQLYCVQGVKTKQEYRDQEDSDVSPKIKEEIVIKTEEMQEESNREAFEIKTEDSIEIDDISKIEETFESKTEEILDEHPKIEAAFVIKTEDPFEDEDIIKREDPLQTLDPMNTEAITSDDGAFDEDMLTSDDETSEEDMLSDSKDDNRKLKTENETQSKLTSISLKKLPKITTKFAIQAEPLFSTDADLNEIIHKVTIEKLRAHCTAQTAKITSIRQNLRRKDKKIQKLEDTIEALKAQMQRERSERALKENMSQVAKPHRTY